MSKSALIVVDLQNDFCEPDGSLKVPGSLETIPLINKLKTEGRFDFVIHTLDWHPKDHWSFAENHDGGVLFSVKTLETGVDQVLWPRHCVQYTVGAAFHPDIVQHKDDIIVVKGTLQKIDSYSGFGSPPEDTGLEKKLRELDIGAVFCCGLATDYCVGSTALDAAKLGFKTTFIEDASRGVAADTCDAMVKRMRDANVEFKTTSQILEERNKP